MLLIPCWSHFYYLIDSSSFTLGHSDDADGRDGEQVEGRRADDRSWSEFSGLEIVSDDFDDWKQDLGSGRAQGHQGQVGDCSVPDGDLDDFCGTNNDD